MEQVKKIKTKTIISKILYTLLMIACFILPIMFFITLSGAVAAPLWIKVVLGISFTLIFAGCLARMIVLKITEKENQPMIDNQDYF